jgi:hypothetical protein
MRLKENSKLLGRRISIFTEVPTGILMNNKYFSCSKTFSYERLPFFSYFKLLDLHMEPLQIFGFCLSFVILLELRSIEVRTI